MKSAKTGLDSGFFGPIRPPPHALTGTSHLMSVAGHEPCGEQIKSALPSIGDLSKTSYICRDGPTGETARLDRSLNKHVLMASGGGQAWNASATRLAEKPPPG